MFRLRLADGRGSSRNTESAHQFDVYNFDVSQGEHTNRHPNQHSDLRKTSSLCVVSELSGITCDCYSFTCSRIGSMVLNHINGSGIDVSAQSI